MEQSPITDLFMKFIPLLLSIVGAAGGGIAWLAKRRDASEAARLQAVTQSWAQVKEQLDGYKKEVEVLEKYRAEVIQTRVDFGMMARRIQELEEQVTTLRNENAELRLKIAKIGGATA